jgi:hypothetical protein
LLLNPPNTKHVDKYLNPKGMKLQASHLVPVDSNYQPISIATLLAAQAEEEEEEEEDEEEEEEDDEEEEVAAPARKTSSRSNGNGNKSSTKGARGPSQAGDLLSTSGPISHWVGRRVKITVGRQRGMDAYVTGSGNGWVQLQHGSDSDKSSGSVLTGDSAPLECAKRSESPQLSLVPHWCFFQMW